MRVGFVGLGQMGLPMARNLLRAGHQVAVWNRSPGRAELLAGDGARAASSPADAATEAEVVVTMLSDDAAVGETVLGEDGVAEGLAQGAVHLGMSTVSVGMARLLRAEHEEEGQHYVSAPVFGRPEAAEAAQLRVVAAGWGDALTRCGPLFDALGERTFVVGEEPAAANVVKLSGNFLLATVIEALGESFALARKSGIAAPLLLEVLDGTLLGSPAFAGYARQIADGRWEPAGFPLALGLKDVRLVQDAADAAEVPMPLAGVLHDRLLTGVARGHAELDWAAMARLAAEDAGLA